MKTFAPAYSRVFGRLNSHNVHFFGHYNTTILVCACIAFRFIVFSMSSTNDVSVASPESAEAKRVRRLQRRRERERELVVRLKQRNSG